MSSVQPAETKTPRKYQLLIDGKWVDAESGKTFMTPNPATGETIQIPAKTTLKFRVGKGMKDTVLPKK